MATSRGLAPVMKLLTAILMICLMLLTGSAPARAQATLYPLPPPFQALSAPLPYIEGDDAAYADPDFDDSGWRTMLPSRLWNNAGISPFETVVWFRVHFTLEDGFEDVRPALTGFFLLADQVFLNGVEIANRGQLGEIGSATHSVPPWFDFSVYPLPAEHIAAGENVLAIRMMRTPLFNVRAIYPVNFGLANAALAEDARLSASQLHWFVDGLLLGINGVLACLAIAAVVVGQRQRLFVSFAFLAGFLFLSHLNSSHILTESGLHTPFVSEVGTFVALLVLVANLEFASAFLGVRIGPVGRSLQFGAFLRLLAFTPFWQFPVVLNFVVAAELAVVVGGVLWISVAAVRAILAGRSSGWTFGIMYTLTATLPVLASTFWPAPFDHWAILSGQLPHAIPTQIVLFYLTALVGRQIYLIEAARIRANTRALNAQFQERRRLSRDIHDTLVQSLGALKLRLQLGQGGKSASARQSGIDVRAELDQLIDQTRRIAHDMSPSSVEELGLEQSIRNLAATYEATVAFTLDIEVGPDTIEVEAQDHLFRIIQEAIGNAVKHGHAKRIGIWISESAGQLVLRVTDDGAGFVPDQSVSGFSIGLRNVRERAELLGGLAEISSAPNRGTIVTVTLPLGA